MHRYRLHWSWPVATVLAVVLAGCSSPPMRATDRLSVTVDLSTTRTMAGRPIKGTLVVDNPHAGINLTQVEQATGVVKCKPGFTVILTRGSFRNSVPFATVCSSRPFVIAHGANRLPFTMITSYARCLLPGGSSSIGIPHCLPSQGPPPLPAGSYTTAIEWSEPVPLPKPPPVTVVLTSSLQSPGGQ